MTRTTNTPICGLCRQTLQTLPSVMMVRSCPSWTRLAPKRKATTSHWLCTMQITTMARKLLLSTSRAFPLTTIRTTERTLQRLICLKRIWALARRTLQWRLAKPRRFLQMLTAAPLLLKIRPLQPLMKMVMLPVSVQEQLLSLLKHRRVRRIPLQ